MGRRLDWFLFGGDPTAAARTAAPRVRAAAGRIPATRTGASSNVGWGFGPPLAGFAVPPPFDAVPAGMIDRAEAISVAAISRSRDLICTAVAQLPLTTWTLDRTQTPHVERQVPDLSWCITPDPDKTRQHILGWTTDDLFFYGVAHWEIIDRYATTYPSAFRRLPPGTLTESGGTWTVTDPATGVAREIDPANIVEFLSPLEGLLSMGWRTISIALRLDQAADRFAGMELPNGWLQQTPDSEDMSGDELTDEGVKFATARYTNTTAVVSKGFEYHPNVVNADALQLVESRGYQALECARMGNVPPYLVGAPAGTGMTYQNGQQARQDLIDFGASAFIGAIEQTLSGRNVTPSTTFIRLDLNAYLRNPFTDDPGTGPVANDAQIGTQ